MSGFAGFPQRILVTETGDALHDLATKAINTSDPWQHTIPPRGGFVLRIDP
jgi:hypothetical protein